MKITPIDITHKNFSKKIMGFDSQEVSDFLQQISSQMEDLIHEKNHLKELLREKELSLLEYKERDKLLKDTISTAAQMSDKIRQESEREAKFIIAEAQQKAEIITRDAKDSLKKTYQDMLDLKKARIQFEANLKALVQAHLAILEQGEKYMPSVSFGQDTNKSNSVTL
ncbi:MAG: DivIVA domain-containing protein [Bdellovibrionaceae bacterium]|nr:DivIVA domain-containing protein [Pseudobdellovibrionaceae bacterium]NUM60112.1 DivIVA domain-containing protein [Pseudobdellovibrionaceae bacterium]